MVTKSTVEGNANSKRIDEQASLEQVTQSQAAPEVVVAMESGLAEIFADIQQTALPTDEISTPFEEAFLAYTQMGEKDFLGEVEQALLKLAARDSGPDFLNLEFEQLFDIQVQEGGSSAGRTISLGSEGSVTSLERFLGFRNPFVTSDENELFVQSQPQSLSFNSTQVYAYSVAPTQSPNLSTNGPRTPPLNIPPPTSQIPLTEASLNSQPFVLIQSNIFIPSIFNNFTTASTGAGLLSMDVFFNFPARAGSSEVRTPGLTTLTTPEGNIFTFNRVTGDFSYQLNDSVSHLQSVWGPNYVNALQDIFTDKFVYAITDVALQTAVGNISVFIVDDVPVATDQVTVAISEADIQTIGSNQSVTPEQLIGSLLLPPGNSFGADGGSVSNVTLPGGTTSIFAGVITVTDAAGNTYAIDQATGSFAYNLSNPFTTINNQSTTLVFTFTFTDADLDTVTRTITFTINDDVPIALAQNAGSLTEADISVVGSDADLTNPTISGDITSGATTVGADGGVVSNVVLTSALSNGVSNATANTTISGLGVITVTDSEGNVLVVNPNGSYTYTLNNAYSNNNNLPTILTYTYTLTDGDGSTATSTLSISVDDDGPVALAQNAGMINEADIIIVGSDASLIAPSISADITTGGTLLGADGGTVTNVVLTSALSNGASVATANTSIVAGVITVTDSEGNVLVVNPDGTYTYTLNTAYSNNADLPTILTFTYTLTDGDGTTASSTLQISVNDDGPVALAQDAGSLNEADIVVLGSDADLVVPSISGDITTGGTLLGADGGTVTNVVLTSALSNGIANATANTSVNAGVITVTDSEGNILVVNPDGIYTFTLNDAYANNGNQPTILTYTYTLTDGDGTTASSTLTFTINDDSPVANVRTNAVDETALFVNGLGSETATGNLINELPVSLYGADGGIITNINGQADDDADGIIIANTEYGSITVYVMDVGIFIAGDYIYTLDSSKSSTELDSQLNVVDNISYVITDGDGSTSSSSLDITVDLNQAPTANPDAATTSENAAVIVNVLGNDNANDVGDTLTLTQLLSVSATYGITPITLTTAQATIVGDQLSFDPGTDFDFLAQDEVATVVVNYEIQDAEGLTSTSTATITIEGTNDAPVADPVNASGDENATSILVTLSGSDIDGTVDNFRVDLLPGNGLLYTDAGLTNLLIASALIGAAGNSADLYFVPAANFNGNVQFDYVAIDDQNVDSLPAQADITVNSINDAPIADPVTASGDEDAVSILVTLSGSDIDGTVDNFRVDLLPGNGLLYTDAGLTNLLIAGALIGAAGNSADLYFVPAANFNGNVQFDYVAVDDQSADSAPAQVDITVNSINDGPIADPVAASGDEDAVSILVTLSGSDIDGTVDNFRVDLLPSNGLLYTDAGLTNLLIAGALIGAAGNSADLYFVPAANFNGNVQFDYVAIDDQNADSPPAQVDITVNSINDVPIADPVVASGDEDDASILVTLLGSDIDGTVDNFKVNLLPSNGMLYTDAGLTNLLVAGALIAATGESADLYFVPDVNFNGNVQFDYVAVDNQNADSSPAQADITINSVNDAPIAVDDSYSIAAGTTITGTAGVDGLLDNDSDPDLTDILTIIAINGSPTLTGIALDFGTLDVGTDGSFNYEGTIGEIDTFNYTISDGNGGEDIAQVSLSVGVPPMILDLNNNNKIDLIDADHSGVTLNSFADTSGSNQMGWVQPGDGILVYDYQGDGKVSNIDEIALTFHSEEAKTDLEALRLAFDTNQDGIFDAKDEKFDKFGVWQDKNSDGKSDAGEYQTLMQMGILSINVNSDHQVQMIEGNTVFGYTSYQTMDGVSHVAGDVSLSVSPATKSVALNEPDIIGEHDSINFSSLPTTEAPLPALASDNVSLESQAAPSESAVELVATSVAIEAQHITQQLQAIVQENP